MIDGSPLMRWLLVSLLVILASCYRYSIPVETEDHPANPCGYTYEEALLPILEIDGR